MHKPNATFLVALVMVSLMLSLGELKFAFGVSIPLEHTISHRQSTRTFTSQNISSQQLLQVLETAYGYTNDHRSTPPIGLEYSLVIFPVNTTGSYQYFPETNSLTIHDLTVNKETIRSNDQNWPSDASIVLVIVWNSTKMDNGYFASAEAGCFVQNVYLAAASLNLGTCCVGGINSGGLQSNLKLLSAMIPLLVMPLGHPIDPYPPASPAYDRMNGNLPWVLYSNNSFEEAIHSITISKNWSSQDLSLQECSQLLWAAYGYCNTSHRTTPDSFGIYSLTVLLSNATGVYQYIPQNHSVTELLANDKRYDIANACSGQIWAADAPAIFLIIYDSLYNNGSTGDGGVLPHEWMEVNAGTVAQQIFLEASAWNLSSNLIGDCLEEWNGTVAEELRGIIGMTSSIVPLHILPVGHKAIAVDTTPPNITNVSQSPPLNNVFPEDEVRVNATIIDVLSGVRHVNLSYTNGNGTWITVDMVNLVGEVWNATIPQFPYCTNVTYVITAVDYFNNTITTEELTYELSYHVIPEFPSLLLPLFTTVTLLSAVIYKRKRLRARFIIRCYHFLR